MDETSGGAGVGELEDRMGLHKFTDSPQYKKMGEEKEKKKQKREKVGGDNCVLASKTVVMRRGHEFVCVGRILPV